MPENQSGSIKTLEYSYTDDDLVANYGASVRWRDYVAAVIIVALIPGLMVCNLSMRGDDQSWIPLIVVILIMLCGAAYPFWRMGNIRRKHQGSKQIEQLVTRHHEFDGRFMTTVASDGAAHRLILADLEVAVTGAELLYLYFNRKQYIAVPWRSFHDEEDIQRLYAMLKANGVRISMKHPKSSWQGFTR